MKPLLILLLLASQVFAADRPRLQIINGSAQPIDIFWLKTDTERVLNGSALPGQDNIITTTLGHRFAIVGREDQAEVKVTSEVPVQAFRFGGVPAFYTQSVSAGGFPIVASAKVNPYALKEAAYLMDLMLARRPDVRDALVKSGARMCIIAHQEFTTDLPEFTQFGEEPHRDFPAFSGKEYWDSRARGTGGSQTDPFCTCAEENVLGYPGDPYAAECIFIHEFAHCIHLRGMANVDPTFDPRLKAAYGAAMKAGLWRGKYASVNHHEYFAEGVQSWFDNNRVNDHDHNHVNTRALLLEYDPGLAAICREVFGDTVIKYTKPATRLTGHLAGYDPASAPTFVWPERLKKVKAAISAKVKARNEAANASPIEAPTSAAPPKSETQNDERVIAGWNVRISKALLAADHAATEHALKGIAEQLDGIVRVVPPAAVAELRKVPLYVSPEYPGVKPRAEYHPAAGWLRANERDPAMEKAVEFTNVRIFDAEVKRMPVFVLHELAHAYHDRVLGSDHPEILTAYKHAKEAKLYDAVERRRTDGRPNTRESAYAISNHKEYFAETSEAFFGTNDYFPFTRDELKAHDPEMFRVLDRVWSQPASTR